MNAWVMLDVKNVETKIYSFLEIHELIIVLIISNKVRV